MSAFKLLTLTLFLFFTTTITVQARNVRHHYPGHQEQQEEVQPSAANNEGFLFVGVVRDEENVTTSLGAGNSTSNGTVIGSADPNGSVQASLSGVVTGGGQAVANSGPNAVNPVAATAGLTSGTLVGSVIAAGVGNSSNATGSVQTSGSGSSIGQSTSNSESDQGQEPPPPPPREQLIDRDTVSANSTQTGQATSSGNLTASGSADEGGTATSVVEISGGHSHGSSASTVIDNGIPDVSGTSTGVGQTVGDANVVITPPETGFRVNATVSGSLSGSGSGTGSSGTSIVLGSGDGVPPPKSYLL